MRRPQALTFSQLFSSEEGLPKAPLQPLIAPPQWNEILSKSLESTDQRTPALMICGPKSSGKSTFAKLLANRITSSLAQDRGFKSRNNPGVALLDLDPGLPEYSPPGQLSLIHVQELDFGPPFAHPIPEGKSRVLRSHSIGAISPSLDPNLYLACALDLFSHYRDFLQVLPDCPLIINTPGWVLGTGLEILLELISRLRLTEVIYMSQEGPWEVVQSLRDAAKSIPVLTLPSQAAEYTTRTAAHLRTMQYMSYFHLQRKAEKDLYWNGKPLTSIRPWEIRYTGQNPGILAVLCYGEQPPASLVGDTINGAVVSIVAIDDMAVITGWGSEGLKGAEEEATSKIAFQQYPAGNTERRALGEDALHPHSLVRPLIISTPDEEIPYFNPGYAVCLDPKHSYSIGLALVRGIDIPRRRIQVLTPIPSIIIEEINEAGKHIVLVSGKLDTPGWAYTEELNQNAALNKSSGRQDDEDMNDDGEDDFNVESVIIEGTDGSADRRIVGDGHKDAPWVETLQGSHGRGVGSRVWRVRRDLGRTADGGD